MSENDKIKVILVGDAFVGKTSLIKVSIGEKFNVAQPATLSASYIPKIFNYNEKQYTFNLWDTSGQEKYKTLTKLFFHDSRIVILVYDITNEKTFNQLDLWYKQINEILDRETYILAIVGNKKDLFNKEKVSPEKGKQFADDKDAKFKLSSAKEDPLDFIEFLEELFKDCIVQKKNLINNEKSKMLNRGVKKGKCCKF